MAEKTNQKKQRLLSEKKKKASLKQLDRARSKLLKRLEKENQSIAKAQKELDRLYDSIYEPANNTTEEIVEWELNKSQNQSHISLYIDEFTNIREQRPNIEQKILDIKNKIEIQEDTNVSIDTERKRLAAEIDRWSHDCLQHYFQLRHTLQTILTHKRFKKGYDIDSNAPDIQKRLYKKFKRAEDKKVEDKKVLETIEEQLGLKNESNVKDLDSAIKNHNLHAHRVIHLIDKKIHPSPNDANEIFKEVKEHRVKESFRAFINWDALTRPFRSMARTCHNLKKQAFHEPDLDEEFFNIKATPEDKNELRILSHLADHLDVQDIDISNKTVDQAIETLNTAIENKLQQNTIKAFNEGTTWHRFKIRFSLRFPLFAQFKSLWFPRRLFGRVLMSHYHKPMYQACRAYHKIAKQLNSRHSGNSEKIPQYDLKALNDEVNQQYDLKALNDAVNQLRIQNTIQFYNHLKGDTDDQSPLCKRGAGGVSSIGSKALSMRFKAWLTHNLKYTSLNYYSLQFKRFWRTIYWPLFFITVPITITTNLLSLIGVGFKGVASKIRHKLHFGAKGLRTHDKTVYQQLSAIDALIKKIQNIDGNKNIQNSQEFIELQSLKDNCRNNLYEFKETADDKIRALKARIAWAYVIEGQTHLKDLVDHQLYFEFKRYKAECELAKPSLKQDESPLSRLGTHAVQQAYRYMSRFPEDKGMLSKFMYRFKSFIRRQKPERDILDLLLHLARVQRGIGEATPKAKKIQQLIDKLYTNHEVRSIEPFLEESYAIFSHCLQIYNGIDAHGQFDPQLYEAQNQTLKKLKKAIHHIAEKYGFERRVVNIEHIAKTWLSEEDNRFLYKMKYHLGENTRYVILDKTENKEEALNTTIKSLKKKLQNIHVQAERHKRDTLQNYIDRLDKVKVNLEKRHQSTIRRKGNKRIKNILHRLNVFITAIVGTGEGVVAYTLGKFFPALVIGALAAIGIVNPIAGIIAATLYTLIGVCGAISNYYLIASGGQKTLRFLAIDKGYDYDPETGEKRPRAKRIFARMTLFIGACTFITLGALSIVSMMGLIGTPIGAALVGIISGIAIFMAVYKDYTNLINMDQIQKLKNFFRKVFSFQYLHNKTKAVASLGTRIWHRLKSIAKAVFWELPKRAFSAAVGYLSGIALAPVGVTSINQIPMLKYLPSPIKTLIPYTAGLPGMGVFGYFGIKEYLEKFEKHPLKMLTLTVVSALCYLIFSPIIAAGIVITGVSTYFVKLWELFDKGLQKLIQSFSRAPKEADDRKPLLSTEKQNQTQKGNLKDQSHVNSPESIKDQTHSYLTNMEKSDLVRVVGTTACVTANSIGQGGPGNDPSQHGAGFFGSYGPNGVASTKENSTTAPGGKEVRFDQNDSSKCSNNNASSEQPHNKGKQDAEAPEKPKSKSYRFFDRLASEKVHDLLNDEVLVDLANSSYSTVQSI